MANEDEHNDFGLFLAVSRLGIASMALVASLKSRLASSSSEVLIAVAMLFLWVGVIFVVTSEENLVDVLSASSPVLFARDFILAAPERFFASSSKADNEADVDAVERLLNSADFEAKIKLWVDEKVAPIKKESLDRIDALKSEFAAKNDQRLQNLERQLVEESAKKSSDKNLDFNALERRLDAIADHRKCCDGAEIAQATEKAVDDLIKGVFNDQEDEKDKAPASDLGAWIRNQFLTRAEAERLSGQISAEIRSELVSLAAEEIRKGAKITAKNFSSLDSTSISRDDVLGIIRDALRTYDADKTGRFDFALESAGGSVVSTRCTENYDVASAVYSLFGIPFWYENRSSPREILRPDASPGRCWAFKGSAGTAVIKLSNRIRVEAITLEHISKPASPDGKIDSAPRQFSVFGLTKIDDANPVLLGNYTYTGDVPVLTVPVLSSTSDSFQMVELDIRSNHGNPIYTCVYRFRVHGSIA